MPDDVLTVKDDAALLKLAKRAIDKIAQAAELRIIKFRGPSCIRRTDVDYWIDAQPRGVDGGGREE